MKRKPPSIPLYHLLLPLLGLLLLIATTSPIQAAGNTEIRPEVRIGVLAKRGQAKTHAKWDATADYLNQRLPGYRFRIVPMLFDDIPILVKNDLVDFVIVNSGIFVDLSIKFGVRRILTLTNRLTTEADNSQFGSVIFTHRENHSIRGLSDLKKKRIAAVHATSLGGWIMALDTILNTGLKRGELGPVAFYNTHDAVAQAVLEGNAEVGVVRSDTLERMAKEGKLEISMLRVINPQRHPNFPLLISTPLYPEWPFAKLPQTSDDLARQIAIALLELPPEHLAARNAHITGWTIPENYQSVHDLLKRLSIAPYDQADQIGLRAIIQAYGGWLLGLFGIITFLLLLIWRIARLNRTLKANQRNLMQNEEQLRVTFEQAAVGIAHLTLNGAFLKQNQKFCEMTGYSARELHSLNLKELLLADDLSTGLRYLNEIRRGDTRQGAVELRLKRADQTAFWARLNISCVRDISGQIKYLVVAIDNIDPIKQLQEENRLSQKQQELILELAGDGILGLDLQANHSFVNPMAARLLGYEVDEMLGRNSHAMWHHTRANGEPFPEGECPIARVLRNGVTHRSSDALFWRKDGGSFHAEYTCTPIIEEKKITGAVVVFREVSSLSHNS